MRHGSAMVFRQTNRCVRVGLDILTSPAFSLARPPVAGLGRKRVSIRCAVRPDAMNCPGTIAIRAAVWRPRRARRAHLQRSPRPWLVRRPWVAQWPPCGTRPSSRPHSVRVNRCAKCPPDDMRDRRASARASLPPSAQPRQYSPERARKPTPICTPDPNVGLPLQFTTAD